MTMQRTIDRLERELADLKTRLANLPVRFGLPIIAQREWNAVEISSDYTWTVPDNMQGNVIIEMIGGGGGGGGSGLSGGTAVDSNGDTNNVYRGGGAGGQSGAYVVAILSVTVGDELDITIGAGGAKGTTAALGGHGVATTIEVGNATLTAPGGHGGTPASNTAGGGNLSWYNTLPSATDPDAIVTFISRRVGMVGHPGQHGSLTTEGWGGFGGASAFLGWGTFGAGGSGEPGPDLFGAGGDGAAGGVRIWWRAR